MVNDMRKLLGVASTIALLSLTCCLTGAAQTASDAFAVRDNQKTVTPEEIVQRFEAPEMTSYTLGDGDEISVEVWNHPELSGKHVVGPDGKITIPIAGIVKVSDLTREDAEKAIAASLTRYYSDLSVTLRVDRYTSYRIYILGRAGVPGILQFDTQPTLLDVVTRAASLPGATTGPDKAGLGRCAILRGRDQIIWVDLRALFSQGNLNLNIAR